MKEGAGTMEEGSLGRASYLGLSGQHPLCLRVCSSCVHKDRAGRSRKWGSRGGPHAGGCVLISLCAKQEGSEPFSYLMLSSWSLLRI